MGQFIYSIARRARVFEATRLLVGATPKSPSAAVIGDRYQYSTPSAEELRRLLAGKQCPIEVGTPETLATQPRYLILATQGQQVVGYVWIARKYVAAAENFSHTPALGTAMTLPPTAAFIFNAWVAGEHRGQAIMASMIRFAAGNRLADVDELMTTVDWTNAASLSAFKKLGLEETGIVARFGIGGFQGTRRFARRVARS